MFLIGCGQGITEGQEDFGTMISMPRVNQILQHKSYEDYSLRNKKAEKDRVYCRHGSDHGLAVARIAYIYLLEEGYELSKEIVYAAGILHDIGRWVEYENKEDHALASARLATPILNDCGFTEGELERITLGIMEHRLPPDRTSSLLGRALALADDWSRDCKNCLSQANCYKYTKAMEKILI